MRCTKCPTDLTASERTCPSCRTVIRPEVERPSRMPVPFVAVTLLLVGLIAYPVARAEEFGPPSDHTAAQLLRTGALSIAFCGFIVGFAIDLLLWWLNGSRRVGRGSPDLSSLPTILPRRTDRVMR